MAYISDTLDVHNAQSVKRNGSINNLGKVSLDHAEILKVSLVPGQFDQILQKVDDVRSNIDVILVLWWLDCGITRELAYIFQLLKDA
jgi:hypothetical protein